MFPNCDGYVDLYIILYFNFRMCTSLYASVVQLYYSADNTVVLYSSVAPDYQLIIENQLYWPLF